MKQSTQCQGCEGKIVKDINDASVSGLVITPTTFPNSDGKCKWSAESGMCIQERPCHITGNVFIQNNYPISPFKIEWSGNRVTLMPGDRITIPVDVTIPCGGTDVEVVKISDVMGPINGKILAKCSKCT